MLYTFQVRAAIEQLCLNDSSVSVEREKSAALGNGWRMGFLGLLHLQVAFRSKLLEFSSLSLRSSQSAYQASTKKTLSSHRRALSIAPSCVISPVCASVTIIRKLSCCTTPNNSHLDNSWRCALGGLSPVHFALFSIT